MWEVARAKWKEEDEYCDDISVIMARARVVQQRIAFFFDIDETVKQVPTAQKTAAPPAPDDSCLGGEVLVDFKRCEQLYTIK